LAHTHQGKAMKTSRSLSKIGVPRPVTGNQPSRAEKPSVLQPGLLPVVIYHSSISVYFV
jgi:hypothetical protein